MNIDMTFSSNRFLVLLTVLVLISCSKGNDSTGPGTGPNPPNPPNPPTPADEAHLKGWWTGYKNGTMNTPPGNFGYSLIYLGSDSFYLQRFAGAFMPGWWYVNGDTINIAGVRSKPTIIGDTLLKLELGTISQYYIRKDTPMLVNNDPRISTIAGTGDAIFNGNNIPALTANINLPSGIAVDNSGNIFFTEYYTHRVRKINASDGKIYPVAGTGTTGFSGDGGPATSAMINSPLFIITDASGNLYLNDNLRIRKIDAVTGVITTIAGNGTAGYSGDGGPATAAQTRSYGGGMCFDNAGNLYFSDHGNNCIRKISSTGIISTIAGLVGSGAGFFGDNGPALSALFNSPKGICFDNSGNLLVADYYNGRVRKINMLTSIVTTIAGGGPGLGDGGPATQAQLGKPIDVLVTASGDICIAEHERHRIRKINAADGIITTIAGTGYSGFNDGPYATWCSFDYPAALSKDAEGTIFIADSYNRRIRKLTKR